MNRNVKKLSVGLVGLVCAVFLLSACNGSGNDVNSKEMDIDTKDAVKSEKKIVDGKEVEEYTLKDGTVIQQQEESSDTGEE